MKFGSVCSGIESASVAWHPLGWKAAWFAEVDRAASDVLAYRFPDVVNHGDMTLLAAKVRAREIVAPDILVGGTPCQGFSIAGLRGSLADPRGQLTLAFVLLADAIDDVRIADGLEPVIIVWENVPGALSTHDNAFGCFIAAVVGDDEPIEPGARPESGRSSAHWTWDKKAGEHRPKWTNAGYAAGPGRSAAWRVQDAQYHGLAQRRRRVFVVASAREGFDPAAILLEFDGVRRDSAPSRKTGESPAGTFDARTTGGGFPGTDGACSGHVVPAVRDAGVKWPAEIACTLNAHFGDKQGLEDQHINGGASLFVPHPITCFSSKDYGADATDDLSPTLRAGGHSTSHANAGVPPAVAYAFQPCIARNGRGDMGEVVNALTAQAGDTGKGDAAPCVAYATQEWAICENPNAGPDGIGVRSDGAAYTLEARSVPQAVCVTGDVTHTLKAEGYNGSEDGTGRGQPIVCGFQASQSGTRINETAGTLDANYGSRRHNGALVDMAVRRLMPVECERLQGFPTVVNLDIASMTRDEVIIAALLNGDIIVDANAGKIFGTRGPGGIALDALRELGCLSPSGYVVINLTANGVKKQVRAHRVIWMSCHGMIPEGYVPDHRNNDKSDNRIDNLQLLTNKENSVKAVEDGLCDFDNSAATKLTAEMRVRVAHDYATHGGSYRDLALKYGVSKSRIGQIVQEHGWTEVPNAKGKLAADGPRYKQCGNSMATNVMNWIGRRIQMHLRHNGGPSLEDMLG